MRTLPGQRGKDVRDDRKTVIATAGFEAVAVDAEVRYSVVIAWDECLFEALSCLRREAATDDQVGHVINAEAATATNTEPTATTILSPAAFQRVAA